MAIIGFEETVGCIELESLGDDRYAAPHIPMDYRRIFGGQLLAQTVAIGAASAPGKSVKSLHAAFPKEGDLAAPLHYSVERTQEGRTFAGRLITGTQGERRIVTAMVSLHVIEPGPSHTRPMPNRPPPEDCPAADLSMIPWETRVVGGVDLARREVGPPEYAFWMRTPGLRDDPVVHQALLAHATDLTVIGTALRPLPDLGESDSPERIQTAVTTHSIWFHAPLRVDQWLLIDQTSPRAAGARGFGLGHVYARDGELVASFAQESLIRPVQA